MGGNIMKTIFSILMLSFITFFSCRLDTSKPNIRTEPGLEYCALACNRMQKLYNKGDKSCFDYIEVIIVDGKEMNCTQFCEYSHRNSINLNPKCIYTEINSCKEIPSKCENST